MKRIAIAVLMFSSICAFAAPKNVKSVPSTGILIGSNFGFTMQGDGVSTTFTVNPWAIPQILAYGATLPKLPIVGASGVGTCQLNGQQGNTYTLAPTPSARRVIVTFNAPPPQGALQFCNGATLLFQPQY